VNEITCCRCEETLARELGTIELIDLAVRRGWNYLRGRFYCPACRNLWREDLRCSG
jgi:hypothetical protein